MVRSHLERLDNGSYPADQIVRYLASDIAFRLAVILVIFVVLAVLFGNFLPADTFCADGLDGVRGWAFKHCVLWCFRLCCVVYGETRVNYWFCMYVVL